MRRDRFIYALLAASALTAGLSWISGSGSFDFMDGTEFVICGRSLELPHPPGYPLYIFLLRLFSILAPCANPDYACFRLFSAMTAGAFAAAAWAAARSFGCSRAGALAGALLLSTSGPVLAQFNVVEVQSFAMLLALLAVTLRRSAAGPYVFSMSVFAGHPASLFLLPASLSKRYREKWVVLAALPASLWLFVPLRSSFGGLCHYSSPADAYSVGRYLTLYGSRLAPPSMRGLEALTGSAGVLTLSAMTALVVLSGKWSWKLFASLAGGLLFVSSYSIPDTSAILWTVMLPLGIWASIGLSRMLGRRTPWRLAALALLAVSVPSGVSHAWRRNDTAAEVTAGDYMRGAPPEAVFVTAGMNTFHSAYLLEVLDRRPDIIPMDVHRCFFRIPPPDPLPGSINGRPVCAVRGWDEERLQLSGLLFTSETRTVDWSVYDVFTYSGEARDALAGDELAEMWARRGIQSRTLSERLQCSEKALEWAVGDIAVERIRILFERY